MANVVNGTPSTTVFQRLSLRAVVVGTGISRLTSKPRPAKHGEGVNFGEGGPVVGRLTKTYNVSSAILQEPAELF